jgi:hypothetical protein
VILLFEPGRVELEGEEGDRVRVGERIGRRRVRRVAGAA